MHVVGGIEEILAKVRGFWMFWDRKGQERRKSEKEKMRKEHGHLSSPLVCMRSSCSGKLHFQRCMYKIVQELPRGCDRTSPAETQPDCLGLPVCHCEAVAEANDLLQSSSSTLFGEMELLGET